MALYSFLAPALARPFVAPGDVLTPEVFFGWRLGQFFEYVVVLHGLSLVIRYWRNDLVEARRKARLAFSLLAARWVLQLRVFLYPPECPLCDLST